MTKLNWQLSKAISAVIFDCDGTLSKIEGIDYLAEQNGAGKEVTALTEQAMGQTGLNRELYAQRLNLVKPASQQVQQLGEIYFNQRVSDSAEVIACLQKLNKTVYVISAGLFPAVKGFGEKLNIPSKNIFAVDITFDEKGQFLSFDKDSPLVNNTGKRIIMKQILEKHEQAVYVGDGLNDLSVQDIVTRFIGYGGSFYRKNIADKCEFYINVPSLSPLLPLVLTREESEALSDKMLYQKGLEGMSSVLFKGA